jgi:hypothetical protein
LADDVAGVALDLQHLPLALSHAAAYLNDRMLTCTAYRKLFADKKRSLARLFPHMSEPFDGSVRTIAATVTLAIERANQAPPAGGAGVLLELGCLLDPNGIPLAAFNTQPAHNYVAARTSGRPAIGLLPDPSPGQVRAAPAASR